MSVIRVDTAYKIRHQIRRLLEMNLDFSEYYKNDHYDIGLYRFQSDCYGIRFWRPALTEQEGLDGRYVWLTIDAENNDEPTLVFYAGRQRRIVSGPVVKRVIDTPDGIRVRMRWERDGSADGAACFLRSLVVEGEVEYKDCSSFLRGVNLRGMNTPLPSEYPGTIRRNACYTIAGIEVDPILNYKVEVEALYVVSRLYDFYKMCRDLSRGRKERMK